MFQSLIDWLDRLGPRLYAAFLEGDRWRLYLQGLLTTLELTVVALIVGRNVYIFLIITESTIIIAFSAQCIEIPHMGDIHVLLSVVLIGKETPVIVKIIHFARTEDRRHKQKCKNKQ